MFRRPPYASRELIASNMEPAPTPSRVRSRPFYSRMCKRANPSNSMIESLPDELLIEILVHLSADEIYDNARLVCRRWRHLIHSDAFVQMHFHRSSSGLLLKPLSTFHRVKRYPVFVTTTTQGRVEISHLTGGANFPIMCSCNGLALCLREDSGSTKIPFILNPATKSAFNLPRFPVTEQLQLILRGAYRLGMAYAAASMAYKVAGSYRKSGTPHCGILTVGVDNAWRHDAIEGLSPQAKNIIMTNTPLMTGCFLHWVSETHVVSLNVETETFTVTPTPALMFPPDYQVTEDGYCPLSTGECLSLLISCGDWSWEVWEMKPETWEWRKVLPKISLEAHKCKIQQFASREVYMWVRPVGWVRYPEVLVFFIDDYFLFSYNIDTEEFESIELSFPAGFHSVAQHRSSLVWSERC